MLLGPVFRAELIRTARRKRYYVLRVVYGFGLLLLLWNYYLPLARLEVARGGSLLFSDLSNFALSTFVEFALLQLGTLIVLIPALLGGVIADEKQRKTMHYLMASRLSSTEIVLDKFLARLLHAVVFVLVGLPVVSLVGLFGGVPWDYVAIAYIGTFSTTFFVAALSTMIATIARGVRQGVLVAYLGTALWLAVPPLVQAVVRLLYPATYVLIATACDWVVASNPISALMLTVNFVRGASPSAGGVLSQADPFLWMVGLQLAQGMLLLLFAILALRPVFRRQEAGSQRLTWFSTKRKRPNWAVRPACGVDAMIWKERYFARTDVLTKMVVLPATILLTVTLVLGGGLDEWVIHAVKDLFSQGYFAAANSGWLLNDSLKAISPYYVGLWLLAVAGATASSVTVEKEEDTWISLMSTPLTGREIVRGKILGAVWSLRGFGGLLSLLWLMGFVLGGIHPLGLLAGAVVVALLTWFVASLGIYASLKSRSTSRAMTSVIVCLVVLNGGYLVPLYAILLTAGQVDQWRHVTLGCTPYLAAQSLFSYQNMREVAAAPRPFMWPAAYAAFIVAGYGNAAAYLMRSAVRRFDDLVDRPRVNEAENIEAPVAVAPAEELCLAKSE